MQEESALHRSLYREHIEEASFLFGQRQQWLADPQLTLTDVEKLERRLEAHVDALVVGAGSAWPQCRDAIVGGDSGDLHAAVRVGCRDECQSVLDVLEQRLQVASDSERVELGVAATLALGFELDPKWHEQLEHALSSVVLAPIVARAIGYRRLDLGEALLRALSQQDASPDLIWAVGELRHLPARDRLRELARSNNPAAAHAATIAGLKLGDRVVMTYVRDDSIVLALAFEDAGQHVLAAASRQPTVDATHALGLCGGRNALSMLVELLGEDELAHHAAASLFLATGATLLEPEEEPDFATLTGEPDEPSARPSRLRLCRDVDAWREQIGDDELGLPRVRMGGVPSAATSANAIATLAVPLALRHHLCDELAIRYGHDLRIRPDMPAREQRRTLGVLRDAGAP